MNPSPDLQTVLAECQQFPRSFQSLHLATSNATGEPEASYAAYVEHDGAYYIYVSELSAHSANLAARARCSVLFIESEEQAKHLFARRRLTLQCSASECLRTSTEFEALMDQFVAKFGEFMTMMRNLADFHLYQLRPISAAYVAGFAQAYTLSGTGLQEIRHRNEQGHRRPSPASNEPSVAAVPDALHETRLAFATMRRENRARHRDIAQRLAISEGELIAAHAGFATRTATAHFATELLQATRLRPEWPRIIATLETLGEVMALTRNEACVHEKIGVYRHVSSVDKESAQIGLVQGDAIDLRVFYSQWAYGFAVVEQGEESVQRSLQFFDAAGVAIHKVFLRPNSHLAAFDALLAQFASTEQQAGMKIQPRPLSATELQDSEIDVKAFRYAWDGMRDTHEFFGLLKKFKLTRLQALRLAREKYVQQVEVEDCHSLLQAAVAERVPIMVFVGNHGMLQIHSGMINKLAVMGPWLNVLDPGFNLHLRQDHIASAWVVKKPSVDGLVTSLEIFDAHGDMIAMFFGQRKPGKPELCTWRALIENLQRETLSCVA